MNGVGLLSRSPLIIANRVLHKIGQTEICWTLLSECQSVQPVSYSMMKFAVHPMRATDNDIISYTEGDPDSPHPAWDLNHTVHRARGPVGAKYVLHCHDDLSVNFCTMDRTIRPFIQDSVYFCNVGDPTEDRMLTHKPDEGYDLLAQKIEKAPYAIAANLLNHGSIVWGRTIAETVLRMHYLRRSMNVQLTAETLGGKDMPLNEYPSELVAELQQRWEKEDCATFGGMQPEYDYLLAEHNLDGFVA